MSDLEVISQKKVDTFVEFESGVGTNGFEFGAGVGVDLGKVDPAIDLYLRKPVFGDTFELRVSPQLIVADRLSLSPYMSFTATPMGTEEPSTPTAILGTGLRVSGNYIDLDAANNGYGLKFWAEAGLTNLLLEPTEDSNNGVNLGAGMNLYLRV